MPKILYTTPNFDDVTSYFREWSREIDSTARMKGWDIYQLDEENVTRENFESRLTSNDPDFVFFNGHGSEDKVYGHKEGSNDPESILISDDNDNLMNNRLVYARVCHSLRELGRKCVEKGATAYIGYKRGFVILTDPNQYFNPLEDKIAKPFMEISNIIPSVLIKGKTVKEALDRSFQQFIKNVEYQETHYNPYAQAIIGYLALDMEALGAIGNPDAKVG
jgi:hypothetical protein